jgi:hypothetical protein
MSKFINTIPAQVGVLFFNFGMFGYTMHAEKFLGAGFFAIGVGAGVCWLVTEIMRERYK